MEKVDKNKPETRTPQVHSEMEKLYGVAENLESVVKQFNNKLEPILRDANSDEKGKDEEKLVPLASEIRIARKKYKAIEDHLRDLIDRIEI